MFVAWRSLRGVAAAVLDRWWLQSVTDVTGLAQHRLGEDPARIALAVAVCLILVGGSLWLVRRRGQVPDDEVGGIVRRYRGRLGPAHGWLLVAAVAVLAWRIGVGASAHWQDWLLFLHGRLNRP